MLSAQRKDSSMTLEKENIYDAYEDTSQMTKDELKEYGYSRMRVMLKLERTAEEWLKERNTPFQQMVLKMAKHHVDRCEALYGIPRQNVRI